MNAYAFQLQGGVALPYHPSPYVTVGQTFFLNCLRFAPQPASNAKHNQTPKQKPLPSLLKEKGKRGLGCQQQEKNNSTKFDLLLKKGRGVGGERLRAILLI
jgi:hypothetical protein